MVGQPSRRAAGEGGACDQFQHAREEPVAEPGALDDVLLALCLRDFQRGHQPDHARHVLGPRPTLALLATSVNGWQERSPSTEATVQAASLRLLVPFWWSTFSPAKPTCEVEPVDEGDEALGDGAGGLFGQALEEIEARDECTWPESLPDDLTFWKGTVRRGGERAAELVVWVDEDEATLAGVEVL